MAHEEKENTDMPDDEMKEANRRYNTPVSDLAKEEAEDIKDTAEKIPADKSEQKTTTSTEGSVERTTERSGDRG